MVEVPEILRPHMGAIYPPNNDLVFEEWFYQQSIPETEREYLPVMWTSIYVNNNYGNDPLIKNIIHNFLLTLDQNKKYFTIVQYDDGTMIDWVMYGLDVLEFNMSKNIGYPLPLLCKPHPYDFVNSRIWFANFIGSKTHPIRNCADNLKKYGRYYISYEHHDIKKYCEIINKSLFTLCFRGYGINSFRIQEAIQYGSIPVYISDEFIFPHGLNFEEYGVLIHVDDIESIDEILLAIPYEEIINKQDKLKEVYENYYTYEANHRLIIQYLCSPPSSTIPIIQNGFKD
jgi:hypothetical protein